MGRHGDDTRKRGLAGWLVATVVGVVVLLAGTVSYVVWLNSDSGSGTVDTSCTGRVTIEIAAGTAAAAVQDVADAFNAGRPEARGSCLTAHVNAIDSTQVAAGLIRGWSGQANPEPAVWVPDNLADLASVAAVMPGLVAGVNDTPLAGSAVVLAVAPASAAGFTAGFSWADILTADIEGSPAVLADGSPVTLALGDPRVDRATGYALESMIATDPASPVTVEVVGGATPALAALTSWSAVSASTAGLLDDLARGSSTFNAVPVLEATLVAFNRAHGNILQAIYPSGPTAGEQLTAVGLSADWVDQTEVEGAAHFVDFLSSEGGAAPLMLAGLRVPGQQAPAADGIDRGQAVVELPAGGATVAAALAVAMGLPDAPLGTSGSGSSAPTAGPTTAATTA